MINGLSLTIKVINCVVQNMMDSVFLFEVAATGRKRNILFETQLPHRLRWAVAKGC